MKIDFEFNAGNKHRFSIRHVITECLTYSGLLILIRNRYGQRLPSRRKTQFANHEIPPSIDPRESLLTLNTILTALKRRAFESAIDKIQTTMILPFSARSQCFRVTGTNR